MEFVEVVHLDGKLRVIAKGKCGFVRFPKDLREEGKFFAVDGLKWSKTHWVTEGDIREVRISKTKKGK